MADKSVKSKRGLINLKPKSAQPAVAASNTSQVKKDSSVSQRTFNASLARDLESTTVSEYSTVDTTLAEGRPKGDLLYGQFLEVLQAHGGDADAFATVQDLVEVCRGVLDELELDAQRSTAVSRIGAMPYRKDIAWLKAEIGTWQLMYALYHDRIMVQEYEQDDEAMNIVPTLGASEKAVVTQLYLINSTLREYQLIVDWLETCYERPESTEITQTCERSVAWENTLFQLENKHACFGLDGDLVKSLDPDAPVRENLPLHALDEEDHLRLSRCIFTEIRQGDMPKATDLCRYFGQSWRAALLEGWRVHEDPNYELQMNPNEKIPIEGNPRRDIWKKCAWMMADSKKFDEYTRGIAGALCGHLESLKSLLGSNWQDLLWGYLKVQIDIRVESELRSTCMKSYYAMPEHYWNGKMTLEQIFEELLVAKDAAVRDYAKSHFGIIQKHLILDDVGELLVQMCRWLDEDVEISAHELRFLAHIVLFMRQTGRTDHGEAAERIIAAYVNVLIDRRDPQLIAYYAATLRSKMHLQLYVKFLLNITETSARKAALDAALHNGLNVENITRQTVETLRQRQPTDSDNALPRLGTISNFDRQKISALEWLTFLPAQRGELLWQTNALIRQYLGDSKTECVRAAFLMVPADSLPHLLKDYGSKDNLPFREDCSIKEYLCYKVYLAGIDSFKEWSQLYHNQPQPPQTTAKNANFTERLVCDQRKQNYTIDLQRWKNKLQEQTSFTADALYNVLLFPEKGWLTDPDTAKPAPKKPLPNWEHRVIQMEKLRSLCIPEVALLLHEVLHQAKDYEACVKLADEIAGERRQLYKVYTKIKLADLLSKIARSSLELLNKKLDPWGYPATI